MSDTEEDDKKEPPKVFSLSGDPYEPTEELLNKPCQDTLNCLEDVLAHAKANQIRGVYVLGWSPQHQKMVRWFMLPPEAQDQGSMLRFLGGLEVAKNDLVLAAMGMTTLVDEDGNPIE